MKSWRVELQPHDEWSKDIYFKARVMNDSYKVITDYANAYCHGDIELAFQKILFNGINQTLLDYSAQINKD